MTVITWDGKTLASDSQVTAGHYRVARFNKLFTLTSGGLLGIAGDMNEYNVIDLFNKSDDSPSTEDLLTLKGDLDALYISKDKEVYHVGVSGKADERSACFYKIEDKKSAAGSGHMLAIVAMEYGATAEEAVKMACKYDTYCSEPTFTLKIKKVKEIQDND